MAKNTTSARCHITAFDELECTIPFHRGLVEAWKEAIPWRSRGYDPDTRAWRFLPGFQEIAIRLLLQHFPDAELPSSRYQRTPHATPAGTDHFAVLHLLPSAPAQLVDAAYRTLAKLCHPDVGGSDATMRRLTEAHQTLSRGLRA